MEFLLQFDPQVYRDKITCNNGRGCDTATTRLVYEMLSTSLKEAAKSLKQKGPVSTLQLEVVNLKRVVISSTRVITKFFENVFTRQEANHREEDLNFTRSFDNNNNQPLVHEENNNRVPSRSILQPSEIHEVGPLTHSGLSQRSLTTEILRGSQENLLFAGEIQENYVEEDTLPTSEFDREFNTPRKPGNTSTEHTVRLKKVR